MFSVRILTTSAALLLATGLAQTPAHACDNLLFPCPSPASPLYPRMAPAPAYPVAPHPSVRWGWQTVPVQPVVTAPSRTAVAKPSKRRTAKHRARQRTTTKAVAAVSKPAVTAAKPATTVATKPGTAGTTKPEAVVATKPEVVVTTKSAAAVARPAAEPTVAAARSVIFAAASLDDVVRSVKGEPDKEEPREPTAKLVAVVDPGEVNEIDLAAAPLLAVPAVAAVAEESKSRMRAPPASATVGQVLAIVLCAVAAACAVRFVTKNA
jgi:hypothetical protein